MQPAIPHAVEPFVGRIVDVDTHEMLPVQIWEEEFGPASRPIAERYLSRKRPNQPGGLDYPDFKRDAVEIDADTVWKLKGAIAPGAADPRRRLEVMDFTGVSRQLIFPSGLGIPAVSLLELPPEQYLSEYTGKNRRNLGLELLDGLYAWSIRVARISDRLRPVVPVVGETVENLLATTKRLLDSGIHAIHLPSILPPGGKSPAHSDLDPFWKLITDYDATATLHIGSERCGFFKSDEWGNAPVFDGYKLNIEANLNPWYLSAVHLPSQNFLAAMVTGGVFERHPMLRFGCIELGAHWIGPLAALLDMWYANNQQFGAMTVDRLPQKPSEYIKRNVRVSPFDFEKVDDYIEVYGLEDVYCYASDFPHIEGGKDPMGDFAKRLQRLGPKIMEKFFVTNGAHLFPA
jgi:predicted TIM-barrel fold metal-dependent hydrolase